MKNTLSQRALAAFAAALGVVILGMTTSAAAGVDKPASHTVTIQGTRFKTADLTVAAGDSIVWVNKDPYPHTATSATGDFDSGAIAPHKSWTYVAKTKGDFAYVCTIHPRMKATLHVK
jgi:plastocyanin